jgi:hypothetical protein
LQRHEAGLSGSDVKPPLTTAAPGAGMLRPSPAQSRIRSVVAAPNYSYEKRQRELAKKRKQEDKRNKKANPRPDGQPDAPEPADGAPGGVQPGAPEPTN